jgi:hypothetical protein
MLLCRSGAVLDKHSLPGKSEMIPDSFIKRIQELTRIPRNGKGISKMIAIFSNNAFQALLISSNHFAEQNHFDQPKLPEYPTLRSWWAK